MTPKKIYLIDTNVLIYDPKALFAFEASAVGLPLVVLEELDHFKEENTDRGRNARRTIRYLDELRERGSLREGVNLDNGGTLRVLFPPATYRGPKVPLFKERSADNDILLTALELKDQGHIVEFISKDLNARVKANALSIVAQDYLKNKVTEEHFYQGWVRVTAPVIKMKGEFPPALHEALEQRDMQKNEFVLLENSNNPHNYRVFRYLGAEKFIEAFQPKLSWPLQARNPQQLMAMNLLMDPNVNLVTLFGPAGTGKTFLALLAGLHQVLVQHSYQKLLISRPVIPLGRDIGYLPGDIQEKLHSWMLPIYDNVEFIVHHAAAQKHLAEVSQGNNMRGAHDGAKESYDNKGRRDEGKQGRGGRDRDRDRDKSQHRHHSLQGGLGPVNELMKQGKLSLEAITYMRGRSIPYQFILIDEVQNLTPHEVKTLITRAGEGSKIVLAGDPYQIDSPYLDFSSNGLVVVSERFKGQAMFGSVYLQNSERSELSKLAGELL